MSSSDAQYDDTHQKKPADLNFFLTILGYARPHRFPIVISLSFLLGASIMGVLSAFCLGKLVQEGLVARDLNRAYLLGGIILTIEATSVSLAYFGRRILAGAASKTILLIRNRMFEKLDELPMRFFDTQPLGRIVTRLTYDVEGLEDFFSGTLSRLLLAALTLTVVFVSMLLTNFTLGLMLAASVIPTLLVTFGIRKDVRYWNREIARQNSRINAQLSEFLNGIPVIRSFGAEKWSQQEFDAVVADHLHSAIKLNVLNAWSRPLILFLGFVPVILLIWVGGPKVLAGTLTLGLFITFVRYCERFSRPISQIAQEIHTIQAAFTSAERITSFLRNPTESELFGSDGTLAPPILRGSLKFSNVFMKYEKHKWVLKNLNFSITAGARVGLVGRTGSGKTSTLALLARLYDFQEGEILLDDRDIRNYSRSFLRKQLAYVSQDAVIFKGSVRANLSLGATVSDKEREIACEKTGLLSILKRRELNWNSELPHQGSNLSHGERQLLVLTRVLLKNPAIVILDEATASMDPDLELLVHKALNSIAESRTTLIIAHRLETLKECQKLLVFNDGELVETGSHEELMRQPNYYAHLVKSSSIAPL